MFDHEVAIVGTGFSGIGIAIALDRAGISDFVLLEKADDIGGTWRDNQYPGACCDVPSQLYSFSYELNPKWSQRFAPAEEIHAYQHRVVEKYSLSDRIQTGFEVQTATFSLGGWSLQSRGGDQLNVRYLISAIGALHIPHIPALPGLESFQGKIMHSSQWDKTYDVSHKNVIVVGSAASAIQIIPQIAPIAAHVSVMQRSANYFIRRKDRAYSSIEKFLFSKLPFMQRLYRWRQYCVNDFLFHPTFINKPSVAKTFVHYVIHRHRKKQLQNPALLKKLTPTYDIGCKRLLLSDDFMPALQRSNVSLVTDRIDRFTNNGLLTEKANNIDADLVVLATGFQTTKLFGDMNVIGPNGLTIDQAWSNEIRAHRSVAVKEFPNLFMMYGPNSNLGHSSIIVMIEAQAKYIARILKTAKQKQKPMVLVKPEAETAYNDSIQQALANTVWTSSCQSWYKAANGHIFSLWPYSTTRFIRDMRKASMDEYDFSAP